MENSPPKITSSDGTVWSEFPGHDPLRSPISSTGGNTYINASASGHSRQVVGNFTTTLTGNVEKAEVNYYGAWVLTFRVCRCSKQPYHYH